MIDTENEYIKVLKKTDKRRKDGSVLYECKCSCGKIFDATLVSIVNRKIRSCGCYRKSFLSKYSKNRTPKNALSDPAESSFNGLLKQYSNSAKRKNLPFNLTKEDFKSLTLSNCFYCDSAPSTIRYHTKNARKPYIYNGIDRLDNNIGYEKTNSVPCCKICNYMKKAYKFDFFLSHIKKIAKNHENP